MTDNGLTRAERMARKQAKAAAKAKLPKMYGVIANKSKAGVVYHNLRKKKDRPLQAKTIVDMLVDAGKRVSNRLKSRLKR